MVSDNCVIGINLIPVWLSMPAQLPYSKVSYSRLK